MVSQKLFAAFAALGLVAGSAALCRPKSSTSVDVASSSTVVTVSTESTTVATTTAESASSTISTDSSTVATSSTESASSSSIITISTESTTLATSTQAASSTTSAAELVITNILINGDFTGGLEISPWRNALRDDTEGLFPYRDPQTQEWSLGVAFTGSSTWRWVYNPLVASRIVPGADYELSALVQLDSDRGGDAGCRRVDMFCVWGPANQAVGQGELSGSTGKLEEIKATCRWNEAEARNSPKVMFRFVCGASVSLIDEVQLVGPLAQ